MSDGDIGHRQPLRNLLVLQALRDQVQDLALASRETVHLLAAPAGILAREQCSHEAPLHPDVAGVHPLDRAEQRRWREVEIDDAGVLGGGGEEFL